MNVSEFYACGRNESVPGRAFKLINIGYILLDILLAVLIAFGNILVLLTVYKFHQLRTSMNVYVVGLALTDLSVGLIAIPIFTAQDVFPVLNGGFFICMLEYSIIIITSGSSSILLAAISIDRYLAIEKPFEYSRIMTTGKAKFISMAIVLIVTFYGCLPFLGWNEWLPCIQCNAVLVWPQLYLAICLAIIFIAVAFVGILNINIFIIANKASRKIHARVAPVPGEFSTVRETKFIDNKRAFKALMVMSGAYAMCFAPFGLCIVLQMNSVDKNIYNIPVRASSFLVIISSCINPVIYYWRFPEFNRAFRKLLGIKEKACSVNNPTVLATIPETHLS